MKPQKAPSINQNPHFLLSPTLTLINHTQLGSALIFVYYCRCRIEYIIDVVGSQLFQSQQHLIQPVRLGATLPAARQGLQLLNRNSILLQREIAVILQDRNQILQQSVTLPPLSIFHSSHKYKVPVYDYDKPSRNGNEAYRDFYRTYRKFTKPYAELTKYADNLTKNKTLLRRKQFDLPVASDLPQKTATHSKIFRLSKYQKETLKEGATEPVQASPPGNEKFDRTISTQYQVYRKLYGKERSKADTVGLNNSINRILAAEMINLQICPSSAKQRSKTIET